jgi:hypothetical protein
LIGCLGLVVAELIAALAALAPPLVKKILEMAGFDLRMLDRASIPLR